MLRLILVIIIGVVFTRYCFQSTGVQYPLVSLPEPPRQWILSEPKQWKHENHVIDARAKYWFKALVLGVEHYGQDRAAKISPVDLAIGWAGMADRNKLKSLTVDQYGRWYDFHWRETPPMPLLEMTASSANTHMIPSNESIRDQLAAIKPGDVVEVDGYLVDARGSDGWKWTTSLTRTDTGGGSCEVLWVEKIRVETPPPG